MLHKTTQLSVMAMAALAIVAVVAVALFAAGGTQAENAATNALPYESGNSGNNAVQPQSRRTRTPKDPTPPATPETPSTPEACAENPAAVVSTGHIALFDVYWDKVDENLVNNPCPPYAAHMDVPGTDREVTNRSQSPINIEETVIHIPDTLHKTLITSGTPGDDEYLVNPQSVLWRATQPGPDGNRKAWIVPGFVDGEINDSPLYFGFSAGLLDPADWGRSTVPGGVVPETGIDGNPVQYEFEALHLNVKPDDRGTMLVSRASQFNRDDLRWNADNPDTNEAQVVPGEYEHRWWAFTKPGTYTLDVHVKGHPIRGPERLLPETSDRETVTSEVREYRIHVGDLADLTVDVTTDDPMPHAGGYPVNFTVAVANRAGDAAAHPEVTINIPDGLTYDPRGTTNDTGTVSYDDAGTLTWSFANLAQGQERRLVFKAHTDAQTGGRELPVAATVKATEELGSSTVVLVDPNPENSTDTVAVHVQNNAPPIYRVDRHMLEGTSAGQPVGDVIQARDPDADDGTSLTYHLHGEGHENFAVKKVVDQGAQIHVADGASLDQSTISRYDLTLEASDGNRAGLIEVTVHVTKLHLSVADVGEDDTSAVFTLEINGGLPAAVARHIRGYRLLGPRPDQHGVERENYAPDGTIPNVTFTVPRNGATGSHAYTAEIIYTDSAGNQKALTSNQATVTWPDQNGG